MANELHFATRADFRTWLSKHHSTSAGTWLIFDKSIATVTAIEALEEALCFGWIDGQIQKIDDRTYRKYFAPRRPKSKWSKRNKTLAEKLEKQGFMTDTGRAKILEAKQNGQWDAPDLMSLTDNQVAQLVSLIKPHERAYGNFQQMPPSVHKTYARAYFDAKTPAGREKRLAWIIDRLDKNLRPMQ